MPGKTAILVGNKEDVRTKMVLVAAKAADVDVKMEAQKGEAAPYLKFGEQTIKYTGAMMRFFGRYHEGGEVYGNSFFESAEVDMWLDWSLMEFANPPTNLEKALDALEKHLDQRVFLVGQRFTLADVAASIPLYCFQQQGLVTSLGRATKRWLGTCLATEAASSFDFVKVPKTAAAAPAAAPAAAAPAGKAPVQAAAEPPAPIAPTTMVDRYSSCVGGRTEIKRIVAAEDMGKSMVGQTVSLCGWVKTAREADKGKLYFIQLNDGSIPLDIQVVIDSSAKGFDSEALV